MARMRTLMPARKVITAAVAAGTASIALAHSGNLGLGADGVAIIVALAAFLGGWMVPPADIDSIECSPADHARRHATGAFLAS